ncbi:MAG: sulfite exporter TauE/SafE family protein, partial [Thermoleophilaceae bacterium]|nr:sulfite exporter TauE/SafE family protein [Thermoleophilaceae bacterium]
VMIGLTTGFVIGITSAGSGTLIAVALIAIFNLSPRNVVGTDVFHAAILLWAAGMAHWVGGGIDFVLVGTLLLGSIPGVILGAKFSVKVPIGALRTALGMVLVASGSATLAKADIPFVPMMLVSTMGIFLVGFMISVRIGKIQNPWTISTRSGEGAPQAASSQ